MATEEERMKILRMIEDGKITPEEGVELLEALDPRGSPRPPALPMEPLLPAGLKSARWFHLVVTDVQTGKKRVDLRLPVNLFSAGVKMGAKFAPQVEGLDTEQLLSHLRSGETGKILEVTKNEDGEHIEVFLE